ncbi:MAG: transglutaminase-like domain-containing protein, partial [candidate division KSB1 bacterium]|nr:transglutaminase-like domain-containing protein [candidate division KSB1 bacterium]
FSLNFDWKYHLVDFKFQESYSGLEFGLGFSFMWGRQREIFQVEEIKVVVTDLYPAYYRFYNTYPLALVSIKNVAGYPIEINIRSYLSSFSERPKDSGFIRIERGKTKDIPVTAIFGPRLLQVSRREQAVLDIEIEARAGRTDKKEISAQIMVHNRNAWNGEIDKLGCFITPDEEAILQLSRRMVNNLKVDEHRGLENFQKAQVIFNELGKMGLRYHRDPNIPFYKDDRVQYAMETITLGSGDCDDLVVLYASLLESLGIKTAFVEVKDPQKEMAHVYLMFDSGLPINQGYLISSNEKRYVSRDRASGSKTIWIPVETTLIEHGFEEAWKAGALAYLQEGLLRNGLAEGWVRIIDVE